MLNTAYTHPCSNFFTQQHILDFKLNATSILPIVFLFSNIFS